MKTRTRFTLKQKFLSQLDAAAPWPQLPLLFAASAALLAALCSFLIYPEVAGQLSNRITTDRYDELGLGVYHNGTLSFYPDPQPTVLRAPVYPYLLAGVFSLGERLLPYSLQIVQALLHGLTCLLSYYIGRALCGPRRAPVVALLTAVHPYLLWYAGRMVIETVSILLFTLIVLCVLRLFAKPTLLRAMLTGIAIGAGVLCKSTYLPFLFLVPLLLSFSRPRRSLLMHALLVVVFSIATIAPWVVRNHDVSGRWGIVQALTGYNFYVGDRFAERYLASPLSYATIIARTDFSRMDEGLPDQVREARGAMREVLQDEWLFKMSMERYWREPGFLLAKVAANAAMFWSLGSTPFVSIFTIVLQLPLLYFFIRSAVRLIKRDGPFCAACIPLWLVAMYFVIHLPVYALARFSVVFIPTMLAFAFQNRSHRERATSPPLTERS
jgi:4-amino-4-deoxy-L-arabinose transferase-like glycosyltransferase